MNISTLEFLSLVTPESGAKVLVTPRGVRENGDPLWFHAPYDSHELLAADIVSSTAKHIYFALGGFREGCIERYKGRAKSNVEVLRALWLDIDVAAGTTKKYPTRRAVGEHLDAFVTEYKLPEPLIVDSGGGFHVYWPFDRDVSRAEWEPLAKALKVAAVKFKLLADHSRTTDCASILRPVGTMNQKRDTPRLVQSLYWSGFPTPPEALAQLLPVGEAAPIPLVLPAVLKSAPALPDSLGLSLSVDHPKSFSRILAKCAQFQWMVEHMQYGSDGFNADGEQGEKVTEPLWRAGLSVVTRCKNGVKHAHTLSAAYPQYDPAQTDTYINRLGDMPQGCDKFNELNADVCNGCAYKGKVKGPLVLGMEYAELEPAVLQVSASVVKQTSAHGFEIAEGEFHLAAAKTPTGYKRTVNGLVRVKKIPLVEDGETQPGKFSYEEIKFADFDIYPVFRTREVSVVGGEKEYATFWRVTPIGEKELQDELTIPNSTLMSDERLGSLLSTRCVYTPPTNTHKQVAEYMRSFAQSLTHKQTYDQPKSFGWQTAVNRSISLNHQPLDFVCGMSRIKRHCINGEWGIAPVEVVHPAASMKSFAAAGQPRGTIEGWAKAASWYQQSYAAEHVALALLAMASPFMRYSKDVGLVMLAWGERGVGKSLFLNLVASVWGDPSEYVKSGNTTDNGLEPIAVVLRNLPLFLDDKLEAAREKVSAEIMMLANGRSKNRMESVGAGKSRSWESQTWSLNTLITSNKSMLASLATKLNSEGELARLLEIEMPEIPRGSWPVAGSAGEEMFKSLVSANSGLIGPLLITEWMSDPRGYVDRQLKYEEDLINTLVQEGAAGNPYLAACHPREYRIHVAGFAAALVVLFILRKHKVVEWRAAPVVQICVNAISKICQLTVDSRPAKGDLISEFINEFHGNFVIVTSEGAKLHGMSEAVEPLMHGRMPSMRIVGRLDHVAKRIYLDRAAFRDWAFKRGTSEEQVLSGLEGEGWSLRMGQNVKMVLGKGFEAANKVQTRVIELRSPDMFTKIAEDL